jgi:hypothetical protein
MNIISLYISNGHNYVGHHGRDAGTNQIQEVQRARCVAGRGIVGDRYFNRESDLAFMILFTVEIAIAHYPPTRYASCPLYLLNLISACIPPVMPHVVVTIRYI